MKFFQKNEQLKKDARNERKVSFFEFFELVCKNSAGAIATDALTKETGKKARR